MRVELRFNRRVPLLRLYTEASQILGTLVRTICFVSTSLDVSIHRGSTMGQGNESASVLSAHGVLDRWALEKNWWRKRLAFWL
jgi:hypothetical protein